MLSHTELIGSDFDANCKATVMITAIDDEFMEGMYVRCEVVILQRH